MCIRDRQVADDRVEQRLNALVLECGATQNRGQDRGECGATDGSMQDLGGELIAIEVLLGDLVVCVGKRFDEQLAGLGYLVGELCRDFLNGVVLARDGFATPSERTVADEVDDANAVS